MKLVKTGISGSLESNDALVTAGPAGSEGRSIIVESVVEKQFGAEIRKLVGEMLDQPRHVRIRRPHLGPRRHLAMPGRGLNSNRRLVPVHRITPVASSPRSRPGSLTTTHAPALGPPPGT